MSVNSFEELKGHIDHNLQCVWYGSRWDIKNISLECETCHEVILSYDKPDGKTYSVDD